MSSPIQAQSFFKTRTKPRKVARDMKPSLPGRPLKYDYIVQNLAPDTLYSAAAIARFALENGLISEESQKEKRLSYQRIRIALGRYSNNHHFPDEGDGSITLNGQSPTPAWFGWRWQKSMEIFPGSATR